MSRGGEKSIMSGEGLKHHCGVIGIISSEPVARDVFLSLRVIQHRGQESAGIAIYNGNAIKCIKGMGLAHEVFDKEKLNELLGNVGIGHVRYSTTGSSKLENAQPVVVSSAIGDIAIAHNGDIVNAEKLRTDLQKKGWAFITTTDSEIIVRLLANELSTSTDVPKAIKNLASILVGAYSLVLLVNDTLYGIRDPCGVRPLCIGKTDNGYIIASESVVFETLEAKFLRDIEAGEVVELKNNSMRSYRIASSKNKAHCMFEWTYFARPDSVLEGRLVFDVRRKIGELIAKEHPVEADVVIPVPDSGRAHAVGYSKSSGIPLDEGLMKNRYIERTFIMPVQTERELTVLLKLNPIKSVIDGKRVVLVDDSIVRGTTMRKIVEMLRASGAKEVHVRLGTPPIIAPCYLGIDMKTRDQFIATTKTMNEIAKEITSDSVGYISIKGLIKAIGHPEKDLCLGCLTGEYPVEIPGEKLRGQKSLDIFSNE